MFAHEYSVLCRRDAAYCSQVLVQPNPRSRHARHCPPTMATDADFERIGNYARMYNPDQNIDRTKSRRTVPLEVICPGYSRTGTLSMQKAMSILGYPNPYHFSSIYDNLKDADAWVKAIDAKFHGKGDLPDKAFFDGMLGHVGAVTDAPCLLFTKELVEFYPDAKVVLVERDIDGWFKSWTAFCANGYKPALYILGRLDPTFLGRIVQIGWAITFPQTGFSENVDQVRVRSRNAYRHHYRDVREMVPKERLLDFKPKDGWEPLCAFLGKPVPDSPFPHENDTQANTQGFAELAQIGLRRIVKNVIMVITIIGVPAGAAYYYQIKK